MTGPVFERHALHPAVPGRHAGTEKVHAHDGSGRPLSFDEVLAGLETDAAARDALRQTLGGAPHEAFFFELAPVTRRTAARPFEAVIVDGAALAHVVPDPSAFAEHFAHAREKLVASFPNLGKDAYLVVPTPRGPAAHYGHLAAFVRSAGPDQVDAVFRAVAHAARARISSAPLWISTAGLGVAWLHFRLDSRSKYYRHAPYHAPPADG